MYRILNRAELDKESICCMSVINPRLCNQRSIHIEIEQRDEGPIPHIHVYLDKTRNPRNCVYVRLDKAELMPGHDSAKMNKKQKKEFLEIMTTIAPKTYTVSDITGEERKATGYQNAVELWIETYGETVSFPRDDEGFPLMPDYDAML